MSSLNLSTNKLAALHWNELALAITHGDTPVSTIGINEFVVEVSEQRPKRKLEVTLMDDITKLLKHTTGTRIPIIPAGFVVDRGGKEGGGEGFSDVGSNDNDSSSGSGSGSSSSDSDDDDDDSPSARIERDMYVKTSYLSLPKTFYTPQKISILSPFYNMQYSKLNASATLDVQTLGLEFVDLLGPTKINFSQLETYFNVLVAKKTMYIWQMALLTGPFDVLPYNFFYPRSHRDRIYLLYDLFNLNHKSMLLSKSWADKHPPTLNPVYKGGVYAEEELRYLPLDSAKAYFDTFGLGLSYAALFRIWVNYDQYKALPEELELKRGDYDAGSAEYKFHWLLCHRPPFYMRTDFEEFAKMIDIEGTAGKYTKKAFARDTPPELLMILPEIFYEPYLRKYEPISLISAYSQVSAGDVQVFEAKSPIEQMRTFRAAVIEYHRNEGAITNRSKVMVLAYRKTKVAHKPDNSEPAYYSWGKKYNTCSLAKRYNPRFTNDRIPKARDTYRRVERGGGGGDGVGRNDRTENENTSGDNRRASVGGGVGRNDRTENENTSEDNRRASVGSGVGRNDRTENENTSGDGVGGLGGMGGGVPNPSPDNNTDEEDLDEAVLLLGGNNNVTQVG
jgi:hypothetical protein